MSRSSCGHHSNPRATDFIRVHPGCPLWSSASRIPRTWGGITTRVPQTMHPSRVESSSRRIQYGLSAGSSVLTGHPSTIDLRHKRITPRQTSHLLCGNWSVIQFLHHKYQLRWYGCICWRLWQGQSAQCVCIRMLTRGSPFDGVLVGCQLPGPTLDAIGCLLGNWLVLIEEGLWSVCSTKW